MRKCGWFVLYTSIQNIENSTRAWSRPPFTWSRGMWGNFAPNQYLSYHLTTCWILALEKGLQFLMFSEICLCFVKNYVIMRNVGRKACKSASHTLFSHLPPTPANEEFHVNLCQVYIGLIIKYKMTAAEPSPLASSVEKTNGLSSKWNLNYRALTLAKQSFGSLSADMLKAHELNVSFWACQKSKRKNEQQQHDSQWESSILYHFSQQLKRFSGVFEAGKMSSRVVVNTRCLLWN